MDQKTNTKLLNASALLGGIAYCLVGLGSALLVWLGLGANLNKLSAAAANQTNSQFALVAKQTAPIYWMTIVCFLVGLIAYRLLALRQGIVHRWIWWAILLSGILMISAGIISGRIIMIPLGISNLLHVYGSKEFLSK